MPLWSTASSTASRRIERVPAEHPARWLSGAWPRTRRTAPGPRSSSPTWPGPARTVLPGPARGSADHSASSRPAGAGHAGSTAGQPTRTVVPARGPATADRAGGVRDASGRVAAHACCWRWAAWSQRSLRRRGLVAVHVHDSHRYVPSRAATLSTSPAGRRASASRRLPASAPQLPPPALVSPANGAIVGYSQRFVTLRWRPVPGAAAYLVQAKFCPPGGCSRTGPNRPYSSSVITVTVTHYRAGGWRQPRAVAGNGDRPDGARGKPSPVVGIRASSAGEHPRGRC